MRERDTIDNTSLIANGLQHLLYETSLSRPSYFRVAREAHLILYRAMVEALRGTANLAITMPRQKKPSFRYREGRLEIHQVDVPGCKKAWRFSEPQHSTPPEGPQERMTEPGSHLLGFYDALAMVQAECFMEQYTHSKVASVADAAMATLEWLHEAVRNEYEHFIPKQYSAPVSELQSAARLCVELARWLVLESGNAHLFDHDARACLESLFRRAQTALTGGPEVA